MISRIAISGGKADKISIWLNPGLDAVLLDGDAFALNVDVSGGGADFSKLQVFIGGTDTFIDEIRLGQSFSDIAPFTAASIPPPSTLPAAVPEPGALGLLSVACCVGTFWLRMRRRIHD